MLMQKKYIYQYWYKACCSVVLYKMWISLIFQVNGFVLTSKERTFSKLTINKQENTNKTYLTNSTNKTYLLHMKSIHLETRNYLIIERPTV